MIRWACIGVLSVLLMFSIIITFLVQSASYADGYTKAKNDDVAMLYTQTQQAEQKGIQEGDQQGLKDGAVYAMDGLYNWIQQNCAVAPDGYVTFRLSKNYGQTSPYSYTCRSNFW